MLAAIAPAVAGLLGVILGGLLTARVAAWHDGIRRSWLEQRTARNFGEPVKIRFERHALVILALPGAVDITSCMPPKSLTR